MKRYLTLFLLLLVSVGTIVSYAEMPGKKDKKKAASSMYADMQGSLSLGEGIISLVTEGSGISREVAVKNALRSAIEQTFGAFVSANTTVINDNLVKDEIVSISSGNVQGYKVLSCVKNGYSTDVSVQAVISINKLVNYAQNKGMSTELAGATFVMNKKMRDLNKKNEKAALENLRLALKSMASEGMFDYSIELEEPRLTPLRYNEFSDIFMNKDNQICRTQKGYAVEAKIIVKANQNTINYYTQCANTLKALQMSEAEIAEYEKANDKYYEWDVNNWHRGCFRSTKKYFLHHICDIAAVSALTGFKIVDNTGKSNSVELLDESQAGKPGNLICYTNHGRGNSSRRYPFAFSGGNVDIGRFIHRDYYRDFEEIFRHPYSLKCYSRYLESHYYAATYFTILRRLSEFSIPKIGEIQYISKIILNYTEDELSKISTITIEPKTPVVPFKTYLYED